MQFKHPEILYFLFLLVIPILVHLFQLRRFKKEFFTNVFSSSDHIGNQVDKSNTIIGQSFNRCSPIQPSHVFCNIIVK
jgi:hypothetical protein